MTSLCRAPFCQSLSREHVPFCPRHWRLLPLKHQTSILDAKDAHRAMRDPLVRAFRTGPALEAALDAAAASLGPVGPVIDHSETRPGRTD